MPLRMAGGSRNGNCPKSLCFAFRSLRRLWKSTAPESVAVELADCMIRILDYCGHDGIDIEEAIRIKHEYNKTRPYRHGGKKC